MIRLDLKREPHWLDLAHGVRVKVRPCSSALIFAARRAAEAFDGTGPEAAGERMALFLRQLAQLAVIEWEGIGDAEGKPAPVTPEGVAALMDHHPIADAFNVGYVAPSLVLDAEGNV